MNEEHLGAGEIESLLQGQDAHSAGLYEHLERCQTCQGKLDAATADTWWWNEGHTMVSSSIEMLEDGMRRPSDQTQAAGYDPLKVEIEALVASFGSAVHPELLGSIDEYEVHSLIGAGGMGAVFKGFERELNRPVAIKFMLPRHAKSGRARQRFAREARAVAAIRNDNVIPIFRINSSFQFPFIVMPLVSGLSLEEYVRTEGALEPSQLVQIALQVANGLAAAHQTGLIHRDIKPANILLENHCNRVLITDFGLARGEEDLDLTQTGVIAGTPLYMSPEQADGDHLDQRTDLFSLGAVMYWMATARPPFRGQSQLEVLKRIRLHRQAAVRSINPAIPSTLERLIDRSLEKAPARRFQSAAEIERFLIRLLAHLQAPHKYGEPRLAPRRHLEAWQYAVLGGLLLALGLGIAGLAFLVPPKAKHLIDRQPASEHAGPDSK